MNQEVFDRVQQKTQHKESSISVCHTLWQFAKQAAGLHRRAIII